MREPFGELVQRTGVIEVVVRRERERRLLEEIARGLVQARDAEPGVDEQRRGRDRARTRCCSARTDRRTAPRAARSPSPTRSRANQSPTATFIRVPSSGATAFHVGAPPTMVGDIDGGVEGAGRGEEAGHGRSVVELDRTDRERRRDAGEEAAELGLAQRVDLDLDRGARGARRARVRASAGRCPTARRGGSSARCA